MFTVKIENTKLLEGTDFKDNQSYLLRSAAFEEATKICDFLNAKFSTKKEFMILEEKKVFTIKKGKKQRPTYCCGNGCCM